MLKYYIKVKNFENFIIKKNNMYIIFIKKNNLFFFINYNNINLYLNYYLIIKKKFINDILNIFFFSWNNFIVKKVKFKHKITWLYIFRKNIQLLKISTNFSEKKFFIINNCKLKRKKNYFVFHSIVIWGIDLFSINLIIKNIINLLFFNCYTQRGFKLARAKLLKRIGKVNKYKVLKGKIF
jgi:hypothetical protein